MTFTTIFKTGCRLILLALVGLLLYFNAAFYYSPDFETDKSGTWNKDVYHQLRHLKTEMHAGAATDMQQLFPEGHLFMNALYGLAWLDFAEATHADTFGNAFILHGDFPEGEAFRELDWALTEMDSPRGRRIFNEDLTLPYGAFYRGWTNYLLARKISLRTASAGEIGELQKNCDAIALALKESSSPYLESYHDGIWPADNILTIASLAAYDRIFPESRYDTTITSWLTQVKTQLDPATGLIPHVVYEGAPPQGARGSSLSLILSLLPEIDSVFAAEQFALYEKHFVTSRLGLPAIREYPQGIEGEGDIDSGPVIWGIGGAASVVGQRAALVNGNAELYVGLRNSIEAFGFAYSWFGEKKYVGGQLPMADAFIAWSNAAEKQPVNAPYPKPWLIHLLSIIILSILIWVIYRI
jgi:hypothetical protein